MSTNYNNKNNNLDLVLPAQSFKIIQRNLIAEATQILFYGPSSAVVVMQRR